MKDDEEELFRYLVRAFIEVDHKWGEAVRREDSAGMRKSQARLWSPQLATLLSTVYKTHLPQLNVRQTACAFGNADAVKGRTYLFEGDQVTVSYDSGRPNRTFTVEWPDDRELDLPDRLEGRLTRAVPGVHILLLDERERTRALPNPLIPGVCPAGYPGWLSRVACGMLLLGAGKVDTEVALHSATLSRSETNRPITSRKINDWLDSELNEMFGNVNVVLATVKNPGVWFSSGKDRTYAHACTSSCTPAHATAQAGSSIPTVCGPLLRTARA